MVASTLQWQRIAVAIAVAGSALVYWTEEGDVFALPKATLIVLVALVALAITGGRSLLQRRVVVPKVPSALAAVAFLGAMGITTLTSTSPMQSFVGQHSQYAGLALYTACVLLFLSVLRSHGPETLPGLVLALVGVAVPVVVLGLLQWQDLDPLGIGTTTVISTMGNQNFLAGWIGAVFPLGLGVAVAGSEALPWRIVGGALAALIVPLSFFTDSFQGPATVGAAGLAFVLLLLATGGIPVPERLRGRRGVVVLVALAVLASPIAAKVLVDGFDQGLLERRYFWRVAVEVFGDEPLVGTGPDTFHNQYLPRRPAEHAALSNSKNAGAAHSVPLDMFANGGLLLGLTYLSFLALVGWRLVVAVRRRTAPPWLLAGIGAAWVGYQVQSFVSIDKPHLMALHWVLAGAVVVMSGPIRAWAFPLPGRAAEGDAPPTTVVAVAGLIIVVLGLGWVATRPIRADLAAEAGRNALAAGDAATATAKFERARELAPWEAKHTFDQVQLAGRTENPTLLIEAAEDGARLEPGDSSYHVVAGAAADAVGDHERATRWFDEALRIDPFGLDPLLRAATSAAKAGERERALDLVQRALDVTRDRADIWVRLGQVYEALNEAEMAQDAFEEALRLSPGYDDAEKGLERLAG